jgi:hypothetical protein
VEHRPILGEGGAARRVDHGRQVGVRRAPVGGIDLVARQLEGGTQLDQRLDGAQVAGDALGELRQLELEPPGGLPRMLPARGPVKPTNARAARKWRMVRAASASMASQAGSLMGASSRRR